MKAEITVDKENLRYWDEKEERFITPKGEYIFMIGVSSEDIRLRKTVFIN